MVNFDFGAGGFARAVAVRLKPGTDLLEGLTQVCKKNKIQNGVIVSALGSLSKAYLCNPTEVDTKAGYGYGEPTFIDGPLELLGASGVVCHDLDGSVNLHVHVTISNKQAECFGGHLAPGTTVLLTTDAVIAELSGIEMERKMDPDLDVPILTPRTK